MPQMTTVNNSIYYTITAKTVWSGTSYCRIHFLPFTRDGRGYAQNTPFTNLWNFAFLSFLPTFSKFQVKEYVV
jgi:hypothetical protein